MNKLAYALLIIGLSAVASDASSWGKTGHRVTGEIAQEFLSKKAKRQIALILADEDLAEISTWADFYRSDPDKFWQRTAGPFHYVTVPKGKHYSEVGAPPQGDAISALAMFAETLRDDNASAADKKRALHFTVHIIGDLHQPLHAGNGQDRGGNQFTVVFHGEVTNLHSVWDTGLVEEENLSYTEYATWLKRKLTREQARDWMETDPVVWVTESTAIRDTIYPSGDRNLRWDYFYAHRDTVRQRLTQGGVRMAAYLNQLFDD